MNRILISIALLALFSSTSFAQFGDSENRVRNKISLLSMNTVQLELELVDSQVARIAVLKSLMRDEMRNLEMDARGLPPEEFKTLALEANKKFEDQIFDVLLPHQKKRLNRIRNQILVGGNSGILGSADTELGKALAITDPQKKELEEIAAKAKEKMKKEILMLKAEMEKEMIGVLDEKQKEIYKKLVGERIEFEANRDDAKKGRARARKLNGEKRN